MKHTCLLKTALPISLVVLFLSLGGIAHAATQRVYADPDKDGYGSSGDYLNISDQASVPSGYILWMTGKDNDNCPSVYNPDQADANGNGIGDACETSVATQRVYADPDKDGYGTSGDYLNISDQASIPSGYILWITGKDHDNCPNVYNSDQADTNVNGIGDACETTVAPVVTQRVYADPDKDGNGTPGNYLNIADTAPLPSGYIWWITGKDSDNCSSVYNPDQADTNHNGIGDACDESVVTQRVYADPDKDGIGTPGDYLNINESASPPSGYILWITGKDNDNCPYVYNPDQADANGNGIGNACEATVMNVADYVPEAAVVNSPDINTEKNLPLVNGNASACVSNSLIKGVSSDAVYYCGIDGKRYAFPNEHVYFSWYADFAGVTTVSDETLASIPLGGVVTYRPGRRMVKITSDPKVYVVAPGGVLRAIPSENAAVSLYGPKWNTFIDDIPDSFWVTYHIGDPIVY